MFVDILNIENGIIIVLDIPLELLHVVDASFPWILLAAAAVIVVQHHSPVRIPVQFEFGLLNKFLEDRFIFVWYTLRQCILTVIIISFVLIVASARSGVSRRVSGRAIVVANATPAVIVHTTVGAVTVTVIRGPVVAGSSIQSRRESPSFSGAGSLFRIVVNWHRSRYTFSVVAVAVVVVIVAVQTISVVIIFVATKACPDTPLLRSLLLVVVVAVL